MTKAKLIVFLKYYLTAIICMAIIFYFSFVFGLRDKAENIENAELAKAEIKEEKTFDISGKSVEINQENNAISEEKDNQSETEIPNLIKIKVPFTSQAPMSIWDAYHEEACEEASLIMVKYYLDKKTLDKNIAEKEIQALIKFKIKKYGDYKDTNAQETAKLAADFYGIKNFKVIYDFKAEEIKKYLAKNKPIIVPAAGRALGNPNFTPPGPWYHNLVLVGYDGDTIIANDPGTRKGEGYKYNINVLYNAIHDFPGKPENIGKGRKAMIILE